MSNTHAVVTPAAQQLLAREERARRHLDAIATVLGRANRIVSGESVSTVVNDDRTIPPLPDVPAWTDGETIWLNGGILRKKLGGSTDARTLLGLKGVNYHELAHVLYTPRKTQEISKLVWEREQSFGGWWQAFMILEDLRAEMLFVTDFPPAINYYTNSTAQFILEGGAAKLSELWPLLAGRLYMPVDLLHHARATFVAKHGEGTAGEIDRIVRKYLRVVYPSDTTKALVLISNFRNLLMGNSVDAPENCGLQTAHPNNRAWGQNPGLGGQGSSANWRNKDAAKDRDEFLNFLEEEFDDFDDEADEDDENGEGNSAGSPSKSKKDGEEAPAHKEAGQESQSADDVDDSDQGDSDEPSGSAGVANESGGSGVSTDGGEYKDPDLYDLREKLLEAAQSVADAVIDTPEIRADIDNTIEAIRQAIDSEVKAVNWSSGKYMDVDALPAERLIVSQLETQLRDLRVDLEPIWLNSQPSGMIDVKAAMLAQPGDLDVFQIWDEGAEEEASTEVVILLDQSSSMNGIMDRASVAMWLLKRAFDESGITCTVLGYNDDWRVLYQPHDKARRGQVRRFPSAGGTRPDDALRQAARILRGSRATNKLLISITDGQWFLGGHIAESLNELKRSGVLTYMFKLNMYSFGQSTTRRVSEIPSSDQQNLCYHEKGYELEAIESIVPIIGNLVTELMRSVSATQVVR